MISLLAVVAGLDARVWAELAFFLLLVALSGLFSGSEVALLTLTRLHRRRLVEQGVKHAKQLDALLQHPQRFLVTILVANNVVNIGAAALATSLAIRLFGSGGVAIATGVTTLLVLTFGEITPKTYATLNNERFALRVAAPLLLLQRAIWPVVLAFETLTMRLMRLFGARDLKQAARQFATQEDFRALLSVGAEEGVIDEAEGEMLHSIIELGDTMVREIMVPRIDVVSVPAAATLEDVRDRVVSSGFSRIPVEDGSLDNVVGVLYARDMLVRLANGERDVAVREVMREPHVVPETQRVSRLLATMREKRVHLAVVLNEFGGTAGIISLEDILEEIVGEIYDEYDLRQEPVRRVDERTAVVDARLRVQDVNDALGTRIPTDGPYETLAGFLFHRLGRLGREGDTLRDGDAEFVLERVTNRRIARVRVVRTDPPTPPPR